MIKIAFIIIGAAVFLAFAAALFDGVLNFGNLAGMALGGVYIAFGFLINRLDSFNQTLCAIIALCILLLIILMMRGVYAAGRTTADREQAVIVLGCKVRGSEPSAALVKRTDAAYRFLLGNPDSVAILSGGQGKGENISEAECMQKLLCDRGILKDRLIPEERSTSTDENIRFSMEIMEQLGIKKDVAIATSEYHQKRAGLISRRYGLQTGAVSSRTKPTLLPTFLLRECFALVREKLRK